MFTSYEIELRANKRAEMTDDEIRAEAPSVFAPEPLSGVSKSYTFLPTARIVSAMREAGWAPMKVEEQMVRRHSHRGYQIHVVRFQRRDTVAEVGEYATEIALLNSHNRSSAYQLHAGLFRFACRNGLLLSDGAMERIAIRHSGNGLDEVIGASLRMSEAFGQVAGSVAQFRERRLSPGEMTAFAEAATLLRWHTKATIPIGTDKALEPRRAEDTGNDLWSVFNRVQENVVRGGLKDLSRRNSNGKFFRKTVPLKSIEESIRINKRLWDLAEQLRLGNLSNAEQN